MLFKPILSLSFYYYFLMWLLENSKLRIWLHLSLLRSEDVHSGLALETPPLKRRGSYQEWTESAVPKLQWDRLGLSSPGPSRLLAASLLWQGTVLFVFLLLWLHIDLY